MLAVIKNWGQMKTSDPNHPGKNHALPQSLQGRAPQRDATKRRAWGLEGGHTWPGGGCVKLSCALL